MRAVKEKANAKINLYLDVISKRTDGFHDIKSVMHSVSLSDEITVTAYSPQGKGVRLFVKGGNFLPTDDKNIAVKAANLFLKRAQIKADIDIRLDKRIPVAAGLAGGSSDAAATLRAMNKLFGKIFSSRALSVLGAELGSDVPYCLIGKTALCEGRGEIITRLPDKLKLYVVIAIADEHISTPMAYSSLDALYSSFDGSIRTNSEERYSELEKWIQNGIKPGSELYNIFESAVLPMCPGAAAIKNKLLMSGAEYAMMSGSGPSVFAIFESEKQAKNTASQLIREGIVAYAVRSV